jgi:hypothetical protein
VDVSVEIDVKLTPTPNLSTGKLDLRLHVESNPSDWDSFRCWLGSGGLLSAAVSAINPYLGIATAIGSLAYVGEVIRHDAGAAVTGTDLGATFKKTNSGSTWADFAGCMLLPKPDPTAATIQSAEGRRAQRSRLRRAATASGHAHDCV